MKKALFFFAVFACVSGVSTLTASRAIEGDWGTLEKGPIPLFANLSAVDEAAQRCPAPADRREILQTIVSSSLIGALTSSSLMFMIPELRRLPNEDNRKRFISGLLTLALASSVVFLGMSSRWAECLSITAALIGTGLIWEEIKRRVAASRAALIWVYRKKNNPRIVQTRVRHRG